MFSNVKHLSYFLYTHQSTFFSINILPSVAVSVPLSGAFLVHTHTRYPETTLSASVNLPSSIDFSSTRVIYTS